MIFVVNKTPFHIFSVLQLTIYTLSLSTKLYKTILRRDIRKCSQQFQNIITYSSHRRSYTRLFRRYKDASESLKKVGFM